MEAPIVASIISSTVALITAVVNIVTSVKLQRIKSTYDAHLQRGKAAEERRTNVIEEFLSVKAELPDTSAFFQYIFADDDAEVETLADLQEEDRRLDEIIKAYRKAYHAHRSLLAPALRRKIDILLNQTELADRKAATFQQNLPAREVEYRMAINDYIRAGQLFCIEFEVALEQTITLFSSDAYVTDVAPRPE